MAWQWLSMTGTSPRSIRSAMASEPVEVVADLEFLVVRGERLVFRAADRKVAARQQIAHAGEQELVFLEFVQCRAHRRRQRPDAAKRQLLWRQPRGIVLARLPGLELALDTVEAAGDERAEREIRVRAGVDSLELDVVALFLALVEGGADAQRRFPVVESPRGRRRGPRARHQPAV